MGVTATPILGLPEATVAQAESWARQRAAAEEFVSLAAHYWDLATDHGGVRPEVAFAQAAKETGLGRFGGVIDASFHNPCGLKVAAGGSNNDPNAHQRFASWTEGITAHLDHLALYAGAGGYPRAAGMTPDPRHFPFLAGKAKSVEALGGNWAPSEVYGQSIVADYLTGLITTMVRVPDAVDAARGKDAEGRAKGTWILAKDGTVFAFGGAVNLGSYADLPPESREGSRLFLAISPNDRGGYDLMADDGVFYPFPAEGV